MVRQTSQEGTATVGIAEEVEEIEVYFAYLDCRRCGPECSVKRLMERKLMIGKCRRLCPSCTMVAGESP